MTQWTAACQASLSITNSWCLLKLVSIELVMPSDHLILCYLLLLPLSSFPSIRVFSNQSALCIRWSKYWSFNISPSNECSGLISFRIDCCSEKFIYHGGRSYKGKYKVYQQRHSIKQVGEHTVKQFVQLRQKQGRDAHPERKGVGVPFSEADRGKEVVKSFM